MNNPQQLIRLKDLAAMLSVSDRTCQRWAAQGRLPVPTIRTGQVTAWMMSDITRWLEHERQQQLQGVQP